MPFVDEMVFCKQKLIITPTSYLQMVRKFEARGMLRKDAELVAGKLAQYENIFVGAMVSCTAKCCCCLKWLVCAVFTCACRRAQQINLYDCEKECAEV